MVSSKSRENCIEQLVKDLHFKQPAIGKKLYEVWIDKGLSTAGGIHT